MVGISRAGRVFGITCSMIQFISRHSGRKKAYTPAATSSVGPKS
jgi:hypothetical protein